MAEYDIIPSENIVNVGGPGTDQHLKARVWDIPAGEWVIRDIPDAKDGLRLGGFSLTEPE
jgi:hypothetical protein